MHHVGLQRYMDISRVHTVWTLSLRQFISITNSPGMNTTASGFPVTILSQPHNLCSHFDIICHLSTIFHLSLGQASFSTMEHSGVAYHCLNTPPCHQQYHISLLNLMLLQSKAHSPTTASTPLPNLSQSISTSRPQALACLTAHTCDRVQHLCSGLSNLIHQVSPFLRHTSGLFEANKNQKGEARYIHFCRKVKFNHTGWLVQVLCS